MKNLVMKDNLCVLYIPDVGELGGATISMHALMQTLKAQHQLTPIMLASRQGENIKFCLQNDIQHRVVGYNAFYIGRGSTWIRRIAKVIMLPYYWLQYKITDVASLKKIENELDVAQIDLIHTNVNRNTIGAILAKKYAIPHVWHIREFGDLDFDCISLRKDYISFMNNNTAAFVAVSKAVAEHWIKKGLDCDKMHVIYNGVATEWGEDNHFMDANFSKIRIVFAGGISKSKGQYQLIKAISLLPDSDKLQLQVDIIGSGTKEYLFFLKQMIKKYGLSNIVKLKGYCQNVQSYLRSYDIGVMCSKAEGFGRVTAEYMMAGLCVIASDTGANTELIKDGETGILYRYGDVASLKDSIQRAMYDIEQRKRMGAAAKSHAEHNFTAEINAMNVYKLYEKVLAVTSWSTEQRRTGTTKTIGEKDE